MAAGERGQGLGALTTVKALGWLGLAADTKLRIEVMNRNAKARRFYERAMGAVLSDETIHHSWTLPDPNDYHVVYELTVGEALANLNNYLPTRQITQQT